MAELHDLISERSARHAQEARTRRGTDLSCSVEDGIHYVTWHTREGYDFLAGTPDSNLILWHSIFTEEDAPERVEELLRHARARGLRIYNDLPAWRQAVPTSVLVGLLGLTTAALLFLAMTRERTGVGARTLH
jgi:hypothetical protein